MAASLRGISSAVRKINTFARRAVLKREVLIFLVYINRPRQSCQDGTRFSLHIERDEGDIVDRGQISSCDEVSSLVGE